ncbi:MAG: hypothetical protein U0166_28115 [Acidobacteriota bacterium]
MRRRRALVTILALGAAGFWGAFVQAPAGDRSGRDFDSVRLADLEVRMWQAYYGKQKVRLFALLVQTLREQFRYPWAKATLVAFRFARAAATFGDARGAYDEVLPDLEAGYAIARDWTGNGFDAKAVAQAELAWWVARRDPEASTPENVGRLIAKEYALFWNVPEKAVGPSGFLRARAGRLRDDGGANADWPEVRKVLLESYSNLHAALRPRT